MASATADEDHSFPQKLWIMVEDKKYDEIIWWNKSGDGFLICEEKEEFLASKILPVYKFKHNNYSSFERQLLNYGFHKRKNGKKTKAYHHDGGYFNKNQPELSKITKRKKKGIDSGVISEVESCQPDQHGTLQETEIVPNWGPLEGGTRFELNNLQVNVSVRHLIVHFGTKQVGVVREFEGNSWLGKTPRGDWKGQTVTVIIEQPDGSKLGKTQFTYMDKGESTYEAIINSKEWSSFFAVFEQRHNATQGSEFINTNSPSLGLQKHEGQQQSVEILQRLIYTAARIGEEKFIRLVFDTSAGRTAFEAYKNKSPLPEDIADAYGHEKIASYFRDITERFSKDDGTSQMQSKVVNWLELVRAESELQSGPSETNLEELQKDDTSETAYFGDTEASSPNSNEEMSDSDDAFKTPCLKDSVGEKDEKQPEKYEIFLRKRTCYDEGESASSGTLPKQRKITLEDDQGLIPAYVQARGERALEAYNRALAYGRTFDKRVKVLLIGQDRASKTSVGKSLRGERFDPDESSSDEVQIIFPVKNAGTEARKNPVSPVRTTEFHHKITAEKTRALLSTPANKTTKKLPSENMCQNETEEQIKDQIREASKEKLHSDNMTSEDDDKKHIEDQKQPLTSFLQDVASRLEELLKEKPIESEDNILPVIWDFAGQHIHHAIHPIFMSPEAIYLLVADLTKKLSAKAECRVNLGHTEYFVPVRDSEDTNLDHILRWMDLIHSLKNCEKNASSPFKFSLPPVILVGTHADLVDEPSKENRLLQNKFARLLGNAEHFVKCVFIDNTKAGKPSDQEQMVSLRKEVLKLAKEMPHTKKEIPLQWLRVEAEIFQPIWQKKKYLRKRAFSVLASQYCKFDNEDDFDELVHFLHARGSIVYHGHAGDRDGLVVLDPQWLIDVLCEIINAKPCDCDAMFVSQDRRELKETGILRRRLLDVACRNQKLDPVKDSLISLMEKYNLICKVPSTKTQDSFFLVPCMLTSTSGEGNAVDKMTSNCCAPLYLTFNGTYFVPGELFSRLVVLFGRWLSHPQYTYNYKLYANEARFAIDENHFLQLVCYKTVIKLFILVVDSTPPKYCLHVLSHLKEFLEALRKECHWLHSMSEEVCAQCPICLEKSTNPCIRHDKKACRHQDCGHYIPLNSEVLCCEPGRLIPREPLQPWLEALRNLESKQISGTESSKQAHKMESIRHPPEVDINLLETKRLPKKSQPWDDIQLPIDILLLTVMECEFLSCLSYLNPGFQKSYHQNLGCVYFGDIGENEEMNLKIALMKLDEGFPVPEGSVNVVKNAAVALRPKAVFSVGYCGSLNRGVAKLGDVVVSAKLTTYDSIKVIGNEIQERDYSVSLKKNRVNLIRNAGKDWYAPLQNPTELNVTVHHDGALLGGPKKVQNLERRQLIQRFPEAVAVGVEGEGVFTAAAHDLEIEWIMIKGISEYADQNNSEVEHWRRFASVMAASLTAEILSDPVAFQSWPHYEGERGEHRPRDQTVKVFPSSRPQVPTANVRVKTGSPSQDELEELSMLLRVNWETLGLRLGFNRAKLTAFHKENESLSETAYEMLMAWKQREGYAATYRVLYDALCHRSVSCKRLANLICGV